MSPNDPKCSFATIFILWWEGQANLVSTMRPSAFAKIVSRGKNNMKISMSTGLKLWCCHCFAFYRFKSATPAKCHVNVMYDHLSCMIMCYIHLHTVMYQEYGNVWWFHALCGQVILQLCPGTTGALWPASRITSPCRMEADQNVGWQPRDTFWQKSKSLGLGYVIAFHIYIYILYIYNVYIIYIYNVYIYNIYIIHTNMVVDQKSFIRKRPFFTNIFSFANLSQAPCWFFAERMLSNSSSYENSSPAKSHKIITDNFFTAL